MRHESQRIINKNLKYEKTKAYATISKLKNKGLSVSESIKAVKILLTDDNTESRQAILEKALIYLELEQETTNGQEELNQTNPDNSCNLSVCPVLSYTRL